MIKVSIVTVCYNSAGTIAETLRSVAMQRYPHVEHIVVDGSSTDGTLRVVEAEGAHVSRVVSEPDNGIYDAMNKGFNLCSGDVVAFLNSDDTYLDETVIERVIAAFSAEGVDLVYGDIFMVDSLGKLKRQWCTGEVTVNSLSGRQIPHPAMFVKRNVLASLEPVFDTNFQIAADFKQQLILLSRSNIRCRYISQPLAKMRVGGASTASFGSYLKGWRESAKAYNQVFGSGGCRNTFFKVVRKIKGLKLFG